MLINLLKILIVIKLLLLLTLVGKECSNKNDCLTDTVTTIDTILDTTTYTNTVFTPKPVYVDTGSVRLKIKYRNVDTMAIIRDYLATRHYADTGVNDTNLMLLYSFQVSENKADSMQFMYKLKRPQTINITKIEHCKPRGKLYGGVSWAKVPGHNFFAPGLLYATKKNKAFQLSGNPWEEYVQLSMYWQIR